MKKKITQRKRIRGYFGTALALLLSLFTGSLSAQNPYPDYDFMIANADGDTLYYRITSATAPYTVAVTRCHDSVFHTLPLPQSSGEIGQPGFLYPVYDYDSLITIPSSVTYQGQTYSVKSIDKEAFYYQKGMHTVVLPASVETIDTGAFYGSTLHQIMMSPNVTRINYGAFLSTPLESIDLPTVLTYIGDFAFSYSSLSEVEIPAGVTVLPYGAFQGCPLTKITFHEGLQEIEQLAFSARYIDTLVFPRSLQKIALGDGLSYENEDYSCRYIEFQAGANPLELADFCFTGLNHLETLILSDNIVRLGHYCFEKTAISSVVIPPQVDTIPEYCFEGCPNLNYVVLPQQLAVIDNYAFSATPMLTQIAIPASVTSIGKKAFFTSAGEGLRVLDIYCETPPAINGGDGYPTFSKQGTIYVRVPCGKTAEYQSAPGWSNYSNLVYEECVGLEEYAPADFKVYPNPASDYVNVQCTMNNVQIEVETVEVLDIYGKLVHTENVTGNPIRVNVSNLPAGVYVLRVTDGDGKEYRQKIVRK